MIRTPPPEIVPLDMDETLLAERREPVYQTKEFYFSGRKNGSDRLRSRLLAEMKGMGLAETLYDHASVVLDEILANGKEHACGWDPQKKFMVQVLHTRSTENDYLHLSAWFPGDGFDARIVRLNPVDEEGNVYVGRRDRGHLFMKLLGSNTAYFNNGCDLHAVLKQPREKGAKEYAA